MTTYRFRTGPRSEGDPIGWRVERASSCATATDRDFVIMDDRSQMSQALWVPDARQQWTSMLRIKSHVRVGFVHAGVQAVVHVVWIHDSLPHVQIPTRAPTNAPTTTIAEIVVLSPSFSRPGTAFPVVSSAAPLSLQAVLSNIDPRELLKRRIAFCPLHHQTAADPPPFCLLPPPTNSGQPDVVVESQRLPRLPPRERAEQLPHALTGRLPPGFNGFNSEHRRLARLRLPIRRAQHRRRSGAWFCAIDHTCDDFHAELSKRAKELINDIAYNKPLLRCSWMQHIIAYC
jgi:hypothetical protein